MERTTFMEYLCNERNQGGSKGSFGNRRRNALLGESFFVHKKNHHDHHDLHHHHDHHDHDMDDMDDKNDKDDKIDMDYWTDGWMDITSLPPRPN